MGDVVVSVLGQGSHRHGTRDGGYKLRRELRPKGRLSVLVESVDLGREGGFEVPDRLAVPGRKVDASALHLLHLQAALSVDRVLSAGIVLGQTVLVIYPERVAE